VRADPAFGLRISFRFRELGFRISREFCLTIATGFGFNRRTDPVKSRTRIRLALMGSFVLAWTCCLCAGEPRPNLLLLFLNNVGYGDLGCYGNREVKTPNIDRLAAEGVRCTDFYVGSPSCSPSRGAILTGRHPERNGLNYQLSADENMGGEGLPRTEKLIP